METEVLSAGICIWGAGLVGYSLAVHLAEVGHKCLLVDVNRECTDRVNSGRPPFEHDPSFLPPLRATAIDNIRACLAADYCPKDHAIHFLCIPTELAGGISPAALEEVISKIASGPKASRPIYILIESTISPAWIDTIVHAGFRKTGWLHKRDYHVGCSPRRDVFGQRDRSLATVAKVYGADSEECAALMRAIYSPFCREMHQASDAKHAVLTKIVENLFRYQSILFANQLSHLLPEFNVAEVLSLAATKWNMDYYHPSLGIGGYCVPLAKDYLAASLDERRRAFLSQYAGYEAALAQSFVERMLEVWPARRVAVLGLSYAPGLKVHTLAPTVRLVNLLKGAERQIKVHDPFYRREEIHSLTGTDALVFPRDLAWADTVVLMTAHQQYLGHALNDMLPHFAAESCIFDNTGEWGGLPLPSSIRYVQVGGRGFYDGR